MRSLKRLLLFMLGFAILVPSSAAWAKKPDYRYKTPKYKYKAPKFKAKKLPHHSVPHHPKVRH